MTVRDLIEGADPDTDRNPIRMLRRMWRDAGLVVDPAFEGVLYDLAEYCDDQVDSDDGTV